MELPKLKDKFKAENIEWRIGRCGLKKAQSVWATALAYVDNRAIQNRLDDVCGQFNWKNEFITWKNNSQLCGISIYNERTSEWITKWDGADDSEFQSTKGGLSDSMKRAACQWGIGRYLYDIPESFVVTSLVKVKGFKYQPKHKDEKYPAFYWDTPSLPDWALPKDPSLQDKYIEINGIKRWNKTQKRFDENYQKQHNLINTMEWLKLQELINKKLQGDIKMFAKWLKDIYKVAFYDIEKSIYDGVFTTVDCTPNMIMDHRL